MISEILLKLIINLLLFLSFGYLLNLLRPFNLNPKSSLKEKLIYSVVFGSMSIITISFSYNLNGTNLDLRILPLTLAGFYGGLITGVFSWFISMLYFIYHGLNSTDFVQSVFTIAIGIIAGFVNCKYYKDSRKLIIITLTLGFFYSLSLFFIIPLKYLETQFINYLIYLELFYTMGMMLIINQIEKLRDDYTVREELLDTLQKLDFSNQEVSVEKNRLLSVLDSVDELVIVTDIHGEMIHNNKNTELLLGISNKKFNCINLKNTEDLSDIFQEIINHKIYKDDCMRIMENPAVIINSIFNLYKDYAKVYSRYTSPVVEKETGNILGRVFIFRDITEEYEREMERNHLLEIEATLGDFAYNATLMFNEKDILTATENIIKKIVPSDFGTISLIEEHRLPMRPEHLWCFRGCQDIATGQIEIAGRCKAVLTGQLFKVSEDKNNLSCNCYPFAAVRGAYMCVPLTAMGKTFGIIHIGNHNQTIFNVLTEDNLKRIASIAAMGISNLRLLEATKEQVVKDHLTGLYNKKYLDEYIDRELENKANHPISMLILDVDKFKNINDTYGHNVGDEVLIELANTVKYTVRNSDVVGRYGGEEFEVLLPKTSFEKALKVGEKIRKAVEEKIISTTAGDLRITISIGVASCPSHGLRKNDIFIASDKALYKAKAWGRNRVVGYHQILDECNRPEALEREEIN